MPHTCPACQIENRIGARFCKRCGAPLTDAPATIATAHDTPAECPACGHPCTPGSRFCSQCGVAVQAGTVPDAPTPAPPPDVEAEPAALASRLGGVALAVSLALLLIAALLWWMGRDRADTGAAFVPPGTASAPVAAPSQVAPPTVASASPPITLEVVAEPAPQPMRQMVRAPGTLLASPVAPAAPAASAVPAASGMSAAPGAAAAASEPSIASPLRSGAGAASPSAPVPESASTTASAPAPATPARAAQGAAPREAPVARTSPPAQRPRPPTSPEQACASSNNFTRPFCISVQCVKTQFREHPSCVRLREQERQRQDLERANGTDG
jgi:hypothetical protein